MQRMKESRRAVVQREASLDPSLAVFKGLPNHMQGWYR